LGVPAVEWNTAEIRFTAPMIEILSDEETIAMSSISKEVFVLDEERKFKIRENVHAYCAHVGIARNYNPYFVA
jgi:hypothetical protein